MWSIYDTTREYTIESSDRSRFMVLLVPQADGQAWSPAVGALGGKALDGGGAPRIVIDPDDNNPLPTAFFTRAIDDFFDNEILKSLYSDASLAVLFEQFRRDVLNAGT